MLRAVLVAILIVAGCPSTDAGEAPAAETSVTSPPRARPSHGGRALAYEPGTSATDQRIARAQDAVRESPNNAARYSALAKLFVRRSRETSDKELLRLAQDAVRAALDRDPDDYDAQLLDVMLLQESHRFTEARDAARQIAAARPTDSTAHILVGDALLELGDFDAAVEAYQRATDLRPDLRTYNRGAHMRWLSGDVEGALELLQLAIDSGSTQSPEPTAWCYVDLADYQWHAGRTALSLTAAERALELVADYRPALRAKARALAATDRADEAVTLYEGLRRRGPQVEELLALADLHLAAGRQEEAEARIAEAAAMEREDPRGLALFYARHRRETERAVELARREIRARRHVYSHDALALALARAGRTGEARAEMARALALGTPDARFPLHEAVVKLAAGDREGARAAYQRALSLQPAADPVLAAELRSALGAPAGEQAP